MAQTDISLSDLRKVQTELFENGDRSLNEKEFVENLRHIVGEGLSEQELTNLFMRVDVDAGGTVDWEELVNYLFLDKVETQVASDDAVETLCLYKPEPAMEQRSNSSACSMHSLKDDSVFACNSDGTVTWFHSLSTGLRVIRTSRIVLDTKPRMPFSSQAASEAITACQPMVRSMQMATASPKSGVIFWKIPGKTDSICERLARIAPCDIQNCVPMQLGAVESPVDHTEMLAVGDDAGSVHVFAMSDTRPADGARGTVESMAAGGGTYKSVVAPPRFRVTGRHGGHSDHITRLVPADNLGYLFSASLDSTGTQTHHQLQYHTIRIELTATAAAVACLGQAVPWQYCSRMAVEKDVKLQ